MKLALTSVLFFIAVIGNAQNNYRFSVGGGFHSLVFTGFRSFENVEAPQQYDVNRIYQQEKYDLDYKNFSSSVNYSFGFAVNWFNTAKWILSQRFGYYKGQFTDEINLQLTDIGDGTVTDYYPVSEFNSSNVAIGTMSNVRYQTELQGVLTSVIFLRKLSERNLAIGGGVYFTVYQAQDRWWNGKSSFLAE